jgi:hypothetical protein
MLHGCKLAHIIYNIRTLTYHSTFTPGQLRILIFFFSCKLSELLAARRLMDRLDDRTA